MFLRQSLHTFSGVHNSDVRDSREYIEKQVLGERFLKRHNSFKFELVRNRLIEGSSFVSFDSAHPNIEKQYVYSRMSLKPERYLHKRELLFCEGLKVPAV